MKTQISVSQIENYRTNGFLVYENLLNESEVAELKSAVTEGVAALGNRKVAGGNEKLVEGDSYYDKVFKQRLNLWRINDTVKKFMLSPELGKMLCELEGIDGIRCWHDQALIKQAYSNPTAWHLDNPYWSFHSPHALSIWIALEDATLENGCMWYLPGSQKDATYKNVEIGQSLGALFEVYPTFKNVDPVKAPLKAGSCGFHNGLTAHGAGANMTRGTRMAMTCAYMPAGSIFNGQQNILPDAYFKSLAMGDVMENDDWNPLVYSRKAASMTAA